MKTVREKMVAGGQRRTSTTETLHQRDKRLDSPLIIQVKKKRKRKLAEVYINY